jgi:hypothetical protein
MLAEHFSLFIALFALGRVWLHGPFPFRAFGSGVPMIVSVVPDDGLDDRVASGVPTDCLRWRIADQRGVRRRRVCYSLPIFCFSAPSERGIHTLQDGTQIDRATQYT